MSVYVQCPLRRVEYKLVFSIKLSLSFDEAESKLVGVVTTHFIYSRSKDRRVPGAWVEVRPVPLQ